MVELPDLLKEHNDHLEQLLKANIKNFPEIDSTNQLRRFSALEALLQGAIQQSLIDRNRHGEIELPEGFFGRLNVGLWRHWAKRSLVSELAKEINGYIKGMLEGGGAGWGDA